MKDKILKWWNRKWNNWEFVETIKNGKNCPDIVKVYKRTSNDGLVEYKIYKLQ